MVLKKGIIELLLAERGMTKTDLAKASGLSRQSVSLITTRGTCEPKNAGRLAKGLGVPVTEIIRMKEEMK